MRIKHLFSGITVGLCLVTVSIPLAGCAQKSDKQSTENTMSNDSRMKRGEGRPGGPQLISPIPSFRRAVAYSVRSIAVLAKSPISIISPICI